MLVNLVNAAGARIFIQNVQTDCKTLVDFIFRPTLNKQLGVSKDHCFSSKLYAEGHAT